MSKPILVLDFDGVIHSYTSGWEGVDIISDPPVPGALEFMYHALDHFDVCVFSSRSNQIGGLGAMQKWLRDYAIALLSDGRFGDDPMLCWLDHIRWPTTKPSAFVTIDDRAITFTGKWPAIEDLLAFKPWNKH